MSDLIFLGNGEDIRQIGHQLQRSPYAHRTLSQDLRQSLSWRGAIAHQDQTLRAALSTVVDAQALGPSFDNPSMKTGDNRQSKARIIAPMQAPIIAL